ncbi:MAG: transporter substrate-binding domain-containing protein, partial [Deltaproteobacteria bacterium]|nr:transporter substrate-binding domain-containing protein [Deltaproteobacteria bacterium]
MLRISLMALWLALAAAVPAGAGEAPLRVAVRTDFPPMEFMDRQGVLTGFSLDYLQAAGKAAGFRVEFIDRPWLVIFDGLLAGEYDIVASSVSITEERKKIMDFSLPYYKTSQTLVIRNGEEEDFTPELKGKRVGVQGRTTGAALVEGLPEARAEVFFSVDEALTALARKEVDCVVCDEPTAVSHIS